MEHRLTLQTLELLFEQLRYDDAEKFINNKQKNIFCSKLSDRSVYAIHARNKIEATHKLVSSLNRSRKVYFINEEYYITCRQIGKYSKTNYKLCDATMLPGNRLEEHYDSHTENEIDEYLLKLNWFYFNDTVTIIE